MRIRSGSTVIRLGADPVDYRAVEESNRDFFNSVYYGIARDASISDATGGAYANSKDETYHFSSIKSDSDFSEALFAAITSGVISNAEAEEIRRFRFNKSPNELNPVSITPPGGTSGSLTHEQRASGAYVGEPPDNRSDTKKFLDWLDCSAAKGILGIPDSVARSACYARNAVLGIALVVGISGVLFAISKISPE